MLARETRTQSFTQNSDNVMSELLRAIQKVRGTDANTEDPDSTEDKSSGSVPVKSNAESSNRFTSVNGSVNTNGATDNGAVKHNSVSTDLPNGTGVAKSEVIETVNGVPPAPPVPPPPPLGVPVTTGGHKDNQKPVNDVTPSSSTSHTPSWTPNRPRRFEANNTINVFAELNSVLQKRFKKNEEENGGECESLNSKSGSGDVKTAKKVSERKANHYSHIKQVSEKLVNGLNIVIVEQNDKPEKSEHNGTGVSGENLKHVSDTKANTSKQLTSETSQGGVKPKLNGTGVERELSSGSTGNVSRLIETYQSSKESLNSAPESPQRLNNNNGIYIAKQPIKEPTSTTKSKNTTTANSVNKINVPNTNGIVVSSPSQQKNSFQKVNGDTDGPKSPVTEQNGLKNGKYSVKVGPQQTSVVQITNKNGSKMMSEDSDRKNKEAVNSSEDEEVVKAVVVHGSMGKTQKTRQPLSTQTEAAIASIMLDKAIESDSEYEVFFEETSSNKSAAVSDSEIDRRKEEIFGAPDIIRGNTGEKYVKEMKEIKEVLSSGSTPTAVSLQKLNKTPVIDEGKEADGAKDIHEETEFEKNKTSSAKETTLDKIENKTEVKSVIAVPVISETKENSEPSSVHIEKQQENGLNSKHANDDRNQKFSSNLDDYRSPRRRRFSNISSDTSSLDSTHNSSGELVVVADVHVSSDDDKVLQSLDGNVSPLSDNSLPSFGGLLRTQAVSGKVSSEVSYPADYHTEQKQFSVLEQDTSSVQYPMDNIVSDSVVVSSTVGSRRSHEAESGTSHVEKINDKEFIAKSETKKSSEVLLLPVASSSHRPVSSDSDRSITNQENVYGGSSEVSLGTASEGSLTSSLANYDIPNPADIPENFGLTSSTAVPPVAPIYQSSPNLSASRGGNSSSNNSGTPGDNVSTVMDSPSASAIDFSEEELDMHPSDRESERELSDSVEQNKPHVQQQQSTHSPSASLTDTEVQNLTRKIDMHESLLSSSPGIAFKSLRSSSQRDEPDDNTGTFRPVVAAKTQYYSNRPATPANPDRNKVTNKLPTKTPSPNFKPPASVIRYESPAVTSHSHQSSPEIVPHLVSEVGSDKDSTNELEMNRESTNQNSEMISKSSSSHVNEVNNNVSESNTANVSEDYKTDNREVNNNNNKGIKDAKGSTTVITYSGFDDTSNMGLHSSVADTSKEQITVINHSLVAKNSQEPATVINHVPAKTLTDSTVISPPNLSTAKRSKSVNKSYETPRTTTNNKESVSVMNYEPPASGHSHAASPNARNMTNSNNESVSVFHYGPPPSAHPHAVSGNQHSQPTVIRYVPVTHVTTGYQRQNSNPPRHHRVHSHHASHSIHAGPRNHFSVEPFSREHHHHQQSGPAVYGQPRGKTTTLFYDFNRRITVPRKLSEESHRSHHSHHRPAAHQQSAVTVMHIAPTRGRHHHTPNNVSGYIKETRPKMAGYGPDVVESGRHGVSVNHYSSRDTLTSLPSSPVEHRMPVSPDGVFSTNYTVQRKPSYTVMSSTSSFTDSNWPERSFLDLRKPRHRKNRSRSRSRSPEKLPVSTRHGDSMQSETDSSLSKTTTDTMSTNASNISHDPPIRLLSMSRSSEVSENNFEQGVAKPQEHLLPGGVTVKIVVNNESKVIIGSSEQSHEGSPFIIDVDEGRMPTADGDGLYKGEEDRPATFYVDARGLRGELGVQVEGPNSIAKCNIMPERDGIYTVTYVPVEVGKYRAVVKWNGKEIPGSPFHPKVVDARKVKVVGGWQHFMDANDRVHLIVDDEKKIPFDVSEAGPGVLTAEVRGPGGKIPCHIEENGHHRRTVCFTPREEGDHHIYASWSDHTLVNAPFHGYAVSRRRSPDPTKVILSGRGLKEAVVHREAEFQIDGSEAGPGRPEVQLIGIKRDIPVRVSALGGGRYRCTYSPETAGAYLLHITWNDRQLRGSPFKVNVINAHYPQKVVVSGEGLKGGVMGRDINVIIDTRKAGPGELTAHCMGPHLVAYCELEDMRDGTYKLNIRPQEPGRHILQIKYGGEHVLGSPYVLRVGAQPDAGKVRVSGPGVEHGILANFQSRFIVETRGAGAGQLTVRIRGPKGAFQVEMLRDSQKDRTIMCRFDPSETGLYLIFVKWSGVDVPGSPFHVYIVDSQQDLMRVHQGQIPVQYQGSTLNRSVYNSEYSSWREDDYRM